MKVFTSTQFYNYSWDYVSAANWCKYPNELSTHVVGVDVLRREFDATKGTLTTERLITCKQPIPRWLTFLVGGQDKSFVREVSVIDRNQKTLTMRSCNLTMCRLLKVYETVLYRPDPVSPVSRTRFEQVAEITAFASLRQLCEKLEDWSVERFGQNASKGKLGFDSVLKNLEEQWIGISDKTQNLLEEVNEKTSEVITEVNQKTGALAKAFGWKN
ncbi:hypothetical protein OGAPHI_000915 [Ogataea philodendri]|uniref:PRELI/MSF1 domain-containing protein n=1 Tax=Ogataea philodendri TaxID=1378263 RepID=A0A9P8T9L3_9ASCO|nr:uncharacterized protein OGAPHI_000915 [Ogataea philodendri]KAH3670400.1 hypothetical protein OGAPHI_000915 [Ogataea philodendri]